MITHIVIGALNTVAACGCLTVAGMKYVDKGEADLVNLLLGSINILCAVYNIAWITEMLNIA
jgi:hypothetical protein